MSIQAESKTVNPAVNLHETSPNPLAETRTDVLLAWEVRFVPQVRSQETVVAEFLDPYRRYAVARAIGIETLPPADVEIPDGFYLLFMPGGSAASHETQKKAAEWIGAAAVETVARSDRIAWRPGRALMQGAPERREETLAALVEFAFYEGELRKLEDEVEADWARAEADIDLTHGVDRTAVARWPHVNEMTERCTRRRIRFARLERHLESPSPKLTGAARRLVSELCTQTEVADRLQSVDDRIEVYEDLYELANDRISEYSYYRSEFKLELWIIVILILELTVMAWELCLTSHG